MTLNPPSSSYTCVKQSYETGGEESKSLNLRDEREATWPTPHQQITFPLYASIRIKDEPLLNFGLCSFL